MIDRKEKKQCNGCKMCKDLCPKDAIRYIVDSEGFWYPQVDDAKCIQCGLCVKRCPNLNSCTSSMDAPEVKAAWSRNSETRLASTSGGIFFELAKYIIQQGGYVAGCVYTEDCKAAKHVIVHTMEELPPLMVSKYLQSDTEGIYKQTKNLLDAKQNVLFVGAPCHCAALRAYLNKEYSNLVVCDFICRGTNSPKAHRKYVECLENKYGGKMISLRSKDKRNGWNQFGQSAVFDNGQEYFATREEDLRVVAYHHGNLMMRESCNACQFKKIPREADITLADFWGISAEEVEDIEKGISMVMLNSLKGKRLFEQIKPQIRYIDKTLADAEKGNVAIYESAPKGKNRDVFLKNLDKMPFDQLVDKYKDRPAPVYVRILRKIKRCLKKLGRKIICCIK